MDPGRVEPRVLKADNLVDAASHVLTRRRLHRNGRNDFDQSDNVGGIVVPIRNHRKRGYLHRGHLAVD
jgi:hypothetical protein